MKYMGFSTEVFGAMVNIGMDIEAKDRRGRTPLFKAASISRNRQTADTMLEVGCKLDALGERGRNLLFHVTFDDRSQLFQHLLQLGLSLKHTNYDGNTLWHVATLCCMHFDLRVDLIDMGVDPEQPDFCGRTPLHVISGRRTSTLDDQSTTQLRGPTTFDKFIGLINHWNDADEDGVTALYITSTFLEYQTRRLLQAGADWTRTTREGSTVFRVAARSRQANIIGILEEHMKSISPPTARRTLYLPSSTRQIF
jgi:ankyrin repeat protein